MPEVKRLVMEYTQWRRRLVRAALRRQVPSRLAGGALSALAEELANLPAGALHAEGMAAVWGNLQLIMIEAGPDAVVVDGRDRPGMAWLQMRRLIGQAFGVLLGRPEWASLHAELREEVLPWLLGAAPLPRRQRLARCGQAIDALRALAHHTSGKPHAWRIHRIVEMRVPSREEDGWREQAGETFRPRRIEAIARAILDIVRERGWAELPLVVGATGRNAAAEITLLVTDIAARAGQPVHLSRGGASAPALAHYLIDTLGIGSNAGMIECLLPEPDALEIRYYLPSGTPASARVADDIEFRAAELLIDGTPFAAQERPGDVLMIDPADAYLWGLALRADATVVVTGEDEETAREALARFWGQGRARIVIDEPASRARSGLRALCELLELSYEVLPPRASPEDDLTARLAELSAARHPLVGLGLPEDSERLIVMDETGAVLPDNVVHALLADYLLGEGYPGAPGMLIRDLTATRLLDRLADLPEYAERLSPPRDPHRLPDYQRRPDYVPLAGDPRALHGTGLYVVSGGFREVADVLLGASYGTEGDLEHLLERRQLGTLSQEELQAFCAAAYGRLLLAAVARRGAATSGRPPIPDAVGGALLLLQLCAVREMPVGELRRRLEERIGASATETVRLTAPAPARLALIAHYLERYRQADARQLAQPEYALAGCAVRYAGGVPELLLEWALADPDGHPAYLVVRNLESERALEITAEARAADLAGRLQLAIAARLETALLDALRRLDHPWKLVDLLLQLQLPPAGPPTFPATLNCRLAETAYARLQDLARPGREAPALLRFVTDQLTALDPPKGAAFAACHPAVSRAIQPIPREGRRKAEG
ncbi:MAG: phosphohexomutase domain-containing protein [Armatimonadota bacterium]